MPYRRAGIRRLQSCIDEFMRIEELASGIGYADVVYIPKKGSAMPILLIELRRKTVQLIRLKRIIIHR